MTDIAVVLGCVSLLSLGFWGGVWFGLLAMACRPVEPEEPDPPTLRSAGVAESTRAWAEPSFEDAAAELPKRIGRAGIFEGMFPREKDEP